MNLTLRAIRFIILLLSGLAAIFLNQKVDGFSGLFGIALTISAALTVIYLFLQFDKPINEKSSDGTHRRWVFRYCDFYLPTKR